MAACDISLTVPEKVTALIQGTFVTIKGPKGQIQKKLSRPTIIIIAEGNEILLKTTLAKPSKKEKMYINTLHAHLNNMIKGVQKHYRAQLKVCSGHFPITVAVEGTNLVIKNFLGEKSPRKAAIMKDVKTTRPETFLKTNL